jgi:hypothetical protein
VLIRWTPRLDPPLLVYLPEGPAAGYRPQFGQAARDAFGRWQRVGEIPVTFRFVNDSTRADVIVRWIEEFPMQRTGQADVRWNGRGWLLSGRLTLATTSSEPCAPRTDHKYVVLVDLEFTHQKNLGSIQTPIEQSRM